MSNQDHIPEHSEGPVANEQPATVLTPEWQEQCCDNAKRTGFIGLDHLIYILAADEQYTEELLFRLWKEYHVSTAQARVAVWRALLERWVFGTVAAVRGQSLNPIKYLEAYTYDPETGELEVYDRKKLRGPAFVRLDELKEYFATQISPGLPMLKLLSDVQLEDLIESDLPEAAKHENAFIRKGDAWFVKYAGKSVILKHSQGMSYIAFLLANKGKDFYPHELNVQVNPVLPAEQDILSNPAVRTQYGLDGYEDVYEELELRKKFIKSCLPHLDELFQKSKSGKAEDIEEWERVKSILRNEYNYEVLVNGERVSLREGRSKLRKEFDRLRKNITKAIGKAKKAMLKNLPEAESFLSDIHTGNKFSYKPSKEINWHITT